MLKGVNLYLVGMMGVGKTTIAQILAKQFDYQFLDTDALIEQATGQAIATIFAESGEAIFRQLETETLRQVCPLTQRVIATGGGIVITPENWSYLRHGVIVWLDIPVEQLLRRLEQDTQRPLMQTPDRTLRLAELYEQRQALYAQADLRVTVDVIESPVQVAEKIRQAIDQACTDKQAADAEVQRLNLATPFEGKVD